MAADIGGRAEGTLYMDDGHSYDYAAKEEFAKSAFVWEGRRLAVRRVAGAASYKNRVERVVVVGGNGSIDALAHVTEMRFGSASGLVATVRVVDGVIELRGSGVEAAALAVPPPGGDWWVEMLE